jgi:hypothetical protein
VKHLLITLISILLLSSFLTSCEKNEEILYSWETSSGWEWKYYAQGIYTFSDGREFKGKWKDGKPWNGTVYDKDGNVTSKYVNGELHK